VLAWAFVIESERPSRHLAGCSVLTTIALLTGCGIDERTPSVESGQGGADTGAGGVMEAQGGSDSSSGGTESGSGGGSQGGSGSGADGGSPERDCGGEGELCCAQAPSCDAGLGCDAASDRCTRCAAFRSVGILEGYTSSFVQGLSGDGRVAVGYSENSDGLTMAFRRDWQTTSAPVALGTLPGGTSSSALAVSYDGFAVVGESESASGVRAFRQQGDMMLDLGTWAADDTESRAADVNGDGLVVAVTSTGLDGNRLAFRWLLGGDKQLLIGMEEARAISADGNTIAGNRTVAGNEGVVWTMAGIDVIAPLAGDAVAFARGLSADGSVTVGVSGACGCRGFHSRAGVNDIADGLFRALDTSADGSVVVGDAIESTCSGGKAAIWSAGPGRQFVACDLMPDGIVPSGWSLSIVTAVSDDGRVLAGEGLNPDMATEGWVAVIGPDCSAP
jgi:probable HAF family extracellular repeat protein